MRRLHHYIQSYRDLLNSFASLLPIQSNIGPCIIMIIIFFYHNMMRVMKIQWYILLLLWIKSSLAVFLIPLTLCVIIITMDSSCVFINTITFTSLLKVCPTIAMPVDVLYYTRLCIPLYLSIIARLPPWSHFRWDLTSRLVSEHSLARDSCVSIKSWLC